MGIWLEWRGSEQNFRLTLIYLLRHGNNKTGNFNSVGVLYILVLNLYHKEANTGKLLQLPKLFNISNEHFRRKHIVTYYSGDINLFD